MIDTLIQWIQTNPNKDTTIEPISIKIISDTNEANPIPEIGPGQVSIVPLDPPGPVSLYLWHTNPEYRAGSFQTRKTILREMLVVLHERFQNELKGRGWNRTKAIEQLESLDTSAVSPQQSFPDLSKALTFILGFQYAEIDENSKRILLFPKDVRSWSNEYPIYLASYGCRSVYVRTSAEEARSFFKSWFFELIDTGYKYEWPVTEATVKELKSMLSEFNVSISAKAKKEEYCEVVGKAQSIRHINNEFV
jgi:hypothetical protein